MNNLDEQKDKTDSNTPYYKLFKSTIDRQKDLIVLLHNNTPILFNKAFIDFTNIDTPKEFIREYSSIFSRFVPYDSYFHAGNIENLEHWVDEFIKLPEEEKIVSMLDYKIDAYAFSLDVQTPALDYALLTFTDISQDLIKRIMIENDTSIDKESLAYDKKYFMHTLQSFYNAAIFNKKTIGITIIDLVTQNVINEKTLKDFVTHIKGIIRKNDMLVRWGEKQFLLAYFVDTAENSEKISEKLRQESHYRIRLGTAIQKEGEEIDHIVKNAESMLL
ncbi:hypothetical protein [Sulfurimonas sp.]|uniref:hypothetical protein n=1 Tax=Sulfurimonas sp. TaxID=2022749 RepID=UPI0025E8BF94|nr:hypothetical protein [Sulfurimonas sp.]MDD5157847.1 hypothetical protein [Sulfurimonas sp.]